MKWWLIGIGAAGVVAVVLLYATGAGRYLKTVALIARATPYEQAGSGAGRILIIGDSTGYGTGAAEATKSVPGRLGQAFPEYQIINNSANGRQVRGAQAAAEALTDQYDLIVLQIGANDLLASRPVTEIVTDMQTLMETVRSKTQHVIILTAGNLGAVPNFSGEIARRYTARSRDYTEAMVQLTALLPQVAYVPLFDEPSNDPFVAEPERYIASDGLHPSGAGYGVWFDKLLPYAEEALER